MKLTKEYLTNEIASGRSLSDIAKKTGYATSSIHRWLKEYRVDYSDTRKKIEKDDAVEMLKNGASYYEIAEKYDCSVKAVADFVRRNGLNIKTIKKAMVEKESKEIQKETETVVCKAGLINKTAQKCLYGGRCGNCDCCDKLDLTGERRRHDPENPDICFDFIRATKKQKESYRRMKKCDNSAVLIS